MHNNEHILISLAPRHAENIFAGRKQIELRRRTMHVNPGTIVWVYVTLPVGSIVGRARITALHRGAPAALWAQFGPVSGLSEAEFLAYLDGVEEGVVLLLEDARHLRLPLSLAAIRQIAVGFNPPQFFIRLGQQHPLFAAFTQAAQQAHYLRPVRRIGHHANSSAQQLSL
jgi:predicted transcriptional regulator